MIKILIAEDEAKTRAALCGRLRDILQENVLVETASDGNEAIAKALQFQPQLVLMDIEMPVKNGLEAAAVVKRQLPSAHIVFLTAYDRFDYAVGAIRCGAEDYLLKPVSEAQMREKLQTLFGKMPEMEESTSPFEDMLMVWLRGHYMEDVTLEQAAQSVGMSPFYFSRQVKTTFGKTFLELFTSYRIEKARQMLASSELSVAEVGRAVGYPDPNYFAKVFKRTTGKTPTAFRSEID